MLQPPPARRRLWPVFVPSVLVLVLAVGWSAFWFYAASQVDVQFDAWRAREAKAGRSYECANRSVAGYPFRLEVRCADPVISLTAQTAEQVAHRTPLTMRLKEILAVAQIYDPRLVIAEFTGPGTVLMQTRNLGAFAGAMGPLLGNGASGGSAAGVVGAGVAGGILGGLLS